MKHVTISDQLLSLSILLSGPIRVVAGVCLLPLFSAEWNFTESLPCVLFLHALQVFQVSFLCSDGRLSLLMSVCLLVCDHCVLLPLGIFSGWGNPSHFLKNSSKSCCTVHTYSPVFFSLLPDW